MFQCITKIYIQETGLLKNQIIDFIKEQLGTRQHVELLITDGFIPSRGQLQQIPHFPHEMADNYYVNALVTGIDWHLDGKEPVATGNVLGLSTQVVTCLLKDIPVPYLALLAEFLRTQFAFQHMQHSRRTFTPADVADNQEEFPALTGMEDYPDNTKLHVYNGGFLIIEEVPEDNPQGAHTFTAMSDLMSPQCSSLIDAEEELFTKHLEYLFPKYEEPTPEQLHTAHLSRELRQAQTFATSLMEKYAAD
ncbi:hypothetical protein SAMN05421788_110158 [Filimonas lacunae]|uniref:Uncharacterized protein n=1 Tax=Filimonas lacunae TaxID=477680 RepID=A0A173MA50_9BACT|nr:hypothetical protein [Filimonas lacunae]BAV04423.1 hypothetical protein FLA_0414 [Filimonas lacunae]SIT31403.1 hypothetical protein SAMN05421788_110158 [Filimonas lacunae]